MIDGEEMAAIVDAAETMASSIQRRWRFRATAWATAAFVAGWVIGAAIHYRPGRAAWAKRCRHWCPSAPRCER